MNNERFSEGVGLSYPVKVDFDQDDGLYIAEFLDLPGCSATGATVAEAYDRAQEAKEQWLCLAREQGLPIPQPTTRNEYSGRILLRLPPSLHSMLADHAKAQSSSLNQYAVHLLSGAVVGDSVSTKIDQLKAKLNVLEQRVNQLNRNLQYSQSRITEQLAGGLADSAKGSTFFQTERGGGLNAAVSSYPS